TDYETAYDSLLSEMDFFGEGERRDRKDELDEMFFAVAEGVWFEEDLTEEEEALPDDEDLEMTEEEDGWDEEYDTVDIASNDTVGLYLKEMARVPLLSTEEEVDLAMRLEAGQAAARKLKHDPAHCRAPEWQTTAQDGITARDHLIRAN